MAIKLNSLRCQRNLGALLLTTIAEDATKPHLKKTHPLHVCSWAVCTFARSTPAGGAWCGFGGRRGASPGDAGRGVASGGLGVLPGTSPVFMGLRKPPVMAAGGSVTAKLGSRGRFARELPCRTCGIWGRGGSKATNSATIVETSRRPNIAGSVLRGVVGV